MARPLAPNHVVAPVRAVRLVAVGGLVALAALVSGCDRITGVRPAPSAAASTVGAAPAPPSGTAAAPRGASPLLIPASFADLAERASPCVVFVKTRGRSEGRAKDQGETGVGTGFVFDATGLILTNHHVIRNAAQISVQLVGIGDVEGTVVGADPPTDVAVLRVSTGKPLPALPLGDSDRLRVGDWVVAIGNPFGLTHTVSAGIISAKERTQHFVRGLNEHDQDAYYDFLQTDASINPGNSGGPLLDLSGAVVGMNTAIRARANNIGFAIPVQMLKDLVPTLVRDGKITRAAMGLRVAAVDAPDAARLGRSAAGGALVVDVAPGGPADRAGIRKDDVIERYQGIPVQRPEWLRWRVSLAGPGKAIRVSVARGRRHLELDVELSTLPAPLAAPSAEPPSEDD